MLATSNILYVTVIFFFVDNLPDVNSIKVTTTLAVGLCAAECLDFSGCESIVFLLSTSENNCLLSSEGNGAKASDLSVTYTKTLRFKTVGECCS